ncbi:anther-specific protein LAT52-like [Salvia hispanica]|uniref:anther-specific protein LAT52-like n=1 Tax=Salvia hispanica TaxID=49212 RepID=UPI00200901C5|nr:anther-specific protein LAT52-like [Salvia hispanica]
MAKAGRLVSVLCILAFATVARSYELFKVEGDVYCDPCRVQFQTPLSKKLSGAGIKVECRNIETKTLTFSVNGTTNEQGHYVVEVVGDHEDDTCEVVAVTSADAACNVPMDDMTVSRIECTTNSGIHTDVRYANPLGFMTKHASPQCLSVLKDLMIDQIED